MLAIYSFGNVDTSQWSYSEEVQGLSFFHSFDHESV